MSESRDGGDAVVDLDGDPVVVGVAFEIDVIGTRDGSEAVYRQLELSCNMLCERTSPWSSVLVGRTSTAWHAWIYSTATTETIAHVEHAPHWTVMFWYHGVRFDVLVDRL